MQGSGAIHCLRWGAVLFLAGILILAHGCHPGDHDDELFAILRSLLP
jgi:hypothetical protein